MPYAPTTWVEGVTKLGPTNMNHIEAGIAAAIPADIVDVKGDLIVASAADTVGRLAVGANNTALVADSAQSLGVKWLDLTTLLVALTTYDAKGDLIVGTADNAAARLAVGSVGQSLQPDPAQSVGMKWAAGAQVQLARGVLGGAQANIDITAISGSYDHLRLIAYLRGDTAAASTTCLLRANGDSGANYDRQLLHASQTSAAASEFFGQTSITVMETMPANTAGANLFGMIVVDIPFYSLTSNNKDFNIEQITKIGIATANLRWGAVSGFWRSNAAITQLTLLPGAGNFVAGSAYSLWGIV